MKIALALFGLVAACSYVEATFFLGTGTAAAGATTVTAATAAQGVALAGIGGLVLGAGIVGLALLASRRGKRSAEDGLKEAAVFSLVAASDSFGCAMKLVCLLEAKPDDELSADDEFILTIFGREPEAPSVTDLAGARGAYDYAAFMGSKFGVDSCEKLFHTCDYGYQEMIAYVGQLRS